MPKKFCEFPLRLYERRKNSVKVLESSILCTQKNEYVGKGVKMCATVEKKCAQILDNTYPNLQNIKTNLPGREDCLKFKKKKVDISL